MHDLLARIRRCWWLVAIGVALGLTGAAAITSTSKPLYVSTAKVYVSIRTQPDSTSLMQGSQFAQQQIASYAQVATSPLVLQPVIARLNLPDTTSDLAGQVAATAPEGTSLIELNVKGGDARQTALIVNAVADELIKTLATLETSTIAAGSPVHGTIVQRGVAPTTAISPRPAYNAGLGLLLGLLLGALAAVARESADTRRRNQPDYADELGVRVLGALTDSPQVGLLTPGREIPSQTTLDAFRRIRINLHPRLQRLGRTTGSTVLVTSAAAGEGKTTLATGLAAAFAEDLPRVLVVDADLRTAALSHRLAPHADSGLSRVLDGSEPDVFKAIVDLGGFSLLPAGAMVPGPSALLTGRLLTPVLEKLTARYDVVLLDAPAIDASSDAAGLSPLAALTVLVANRHITPGPAVRAAIAAIDDAGGHVIGAVVNGHREEKRARWIPARPRQMRHSTNTHEGVPLEQRGIGTRMALGVRGVGERLRHVRRDVPGGRPALPVVRRPEPLPGAHPAGDAPRA